MKTIKTLSEINEIAKDQTVYIRWSRGPELDKAQKNSRDYQAHTIHNGLSCQRVYADDWKMPMMLVEYVYLRRKDNKIFGWIFTAEQIGRDSDGAPTVDSETIIPIGKLSENLVTELIDYNQKFWNYYNRKGEKPELPR